MNEAIEAAVQTILRGGTPIMPTRRAFPRYSAAYPILIESERRQGEEIEGVTINLARSGMLARFSGPVTLGSPCTITFLPWDRYEPEIVECPHCASQFPVLQLPDEPVRGSVVRVEREQGGEVVAAIMFDEPLTSVTDDEAA